MIHFTKSTRYVRCLVVATDDHDRVFDYVPLHDATKVAELVERATRVQQAYPEVAKAFWVASVPAFLRGGRMTPLRTWCHSLYRAWAWLGYVVQPVRCPYEDVATSDCPDRCPNGVQSCIPF